MVKSTPSTALSQPTVRLGKPRVMGKCFIRPLTSSMAGIRLLVWEEMTTYPMVGEDFLRCRLVLPTHRYGKLAARMKATSRWWLDELQHDPRNPPQFPLLALREAVEELPGIWMRRMAEGRSRRGHLGFLPGIHHHHTVTELGHHT